MVLPAQIVILFGLVPPPVLCDKSEVQLTMLGGSTRIARFTILTTRSAGVYSCEFDVQPIEGQITPGEIFEISDRGSPFEYPILAVLPHRKGDTATTLVCLNWALPDGPLNGMTCESHAMKSAQKKRYEKYIHAA